MEYRFTKLDDVTVKINGEFIGALTDVRYSVEYSYNTVTGPDIKNPHYDIEISYRPIIGTHRYQLYGVNGVDVIIYDPWQSVTFTGCKSRALTNRTDKDGMIETVRLTGFDMHIAAG